MHLNIFGFKLDVQLLILIAVIYLILVVHTLAGCSNVGLFESIKLAEGFANRLIGGGKIGLEGMANAVNDAINDAPMPAGEIVSKPKDGASKPHSSVSGKEGFIGGVSNGVPFASFSLSDDKPINTENWKGPSSNNVFNRTTDPSKDGEMFMFSGTQFKPECCPNTYSTSQGCACMTTKQYSNLNARAGNNVPYSEF